MLKCVKLVTFGELHNARTVGDAEVCKKKKRRLHLVDCVMPELYEMLKVCKKKNGYTWWIV